MRCHKEGIRRNENKDLVIETKTLNVTDRGNVKRIHTKGLVSTKEITEMEIDGGNKMCHLTR